MKKLLIVLCVSMFLLCCSCGKPDSVSAITQYAKEAYGTCELKSQSKEKDSTTCYFLDKEYSFEYCVTSSRQDVRIDGAVFGYTEVKTSNFEKQYFNNCIDHYMDILDTNTDIKITIPDHYFDVYNYKDEIVAAQILYCEEKADVIDEMAKQIRDIFKTYDTRCYWNNIEILIIDENENTLYKFDTRHDDKIMPEDERIEYFTDVAKMIDSNAIYVRNEQKAFRDTGIDSNRLVNILGNPEITDDSIITYYYFKVDNKEFFIADIYVYNEDYSSSTWYTNHQDYALV